MDVALQVVTIFAATRGYLDDVSVETIKTWEDGLHSYIHTHQKTILDQINSGCKLGEIEQKLEQVITEYKARS